MQEKIERFGSCLSLMDIQYINAIFTTNSCDGLCTNQIHMQRTIAYKAAGLLDEIRDSDEFNQNLYDAKKMWLLVKVNEHRKSLINNLLSSTVDILRMSSIEYFNETEKNKLKQKMGVKWHDHIEELWQIKEDHIQIIEDVLLLKQNTSILKRIKNLKAAEDNQIVTHITTVHLIFKKDQKTTQEATQCINISNAIISELDSYTEGKIKKLRTSLNDQGKEEILDTLWQMSKKGKMFSAEGEKVYKSLGYFIYRQLYIGMAALGGLGILLYSCLNCCCYGAESGIIFGVGISIAALASVITLVSVNIDSSVANDRSQKIFNFFLGISSGPLFSVPWIWGSLLIANALGFATSLELLAVVGAIGGAAQQIIGYPTMYQNKYDRRAFYGHILSVPIMAGVGACSMLVADALLTSLSNTAGFSVLASDCVICAYTLLPIGLYIACNALMNIALNYTEKSKETIIV